MHAKKLPDKKSGKERGSENPKEEKVGLTCKKSDNFSEWYNQVVVKSGLAEYGDVKGFLVHRPWSVLAMKKMYRFYEDEFEKNGHKPVWFPAVIPESYFKKESEHVEGFAPQVFWITETGDGEKLTEKLGLRPTSETAMYTMYAKWVRSWRDLPLKIYQSCQVWRYETKTTRPFIRGREFYWIEGHDVFETEKQAFNQVKEDMKMTEDVMHKVFGIPFISFRRPEWDKFPGAVHTYAADTLMPDGKILQQPSTHLLGQNFAKSFGIKFKGRSGKEELAWQTCHGPAIWRMMASVISIHGDDQGLNFPWEISPLQVIIVPIFTDKNKKVVLKKSREIMDKIKDKFSVETDEREEYSPGWKFNEWELKGVPIRLEIGSNEIKARKITLFRRDKKERVKVPEGRLLAEIERIGKNISKTLKERADNFFKGKIHEAKNMEELKRKLRLGGFAKVDFCSIDVDGEGCAEKIKEMVHADVRGVRFDKTEKPHGKCIVCGKKAKEVVYVAKAY